jgi:predicted RNA-binding Zn-ribbon protein involved in translation (DUF1610 family)
MADYELFGLTGLPFDPPEKAPKKVKEAIEKKLKELGTSLGNESQQLKRNEYNGAIAFLKACLGEGDASLPIFDGGKLNALYIELAETRTKKEISILKATVDFQKQSGAHVITNGTIRTQVRKTRLSKENVEKIYQEAGFTISTVDPNKAYPKFPTNADKIYDELKVLRGMKDQNPQGHDLAMCVDLYAFTAYLSSTPGNAAENPVEYKSKSTSELKSILDGFSRPLSQRNDPLGKLLASIASAGKSYVFNSEDSRAAYEKHLLYRSPQMEKIFAIIQTVPDTEKYEPKFAESCIKQISTVFGEYDIALAIYNKEAGIKDEPYIPEKAVFHVKCSHCQNLSEFADVTDAQKINKCSHCGKALYKQCNKCKKPVLASLDKCPECGFVFASTAMFAKFFAAAEQALRRSDFEQARNNLFQAQSADPSEKARTAELEVRINAEEKKYEKPVNDLRKLIADKCFQQASVVLADTIGRFPGLNVSAFDSQVKAALNGARTAFANAKSLSSSKQADACLAILQECADFKPAVDLLRATPPEPCKSFSVGLDSDGGNANLSWAHSTEFGVTYRIIRKQGSAIPANEMDGEILLDNTTDTAHRDKGIQPGRNYSYAAFTARYGVFSSAVGKTVVLLADVTDPRCEQIDTTIRLTWNNPKNCTGVSIKRTAEGSTTTLTNNANGSFEDKGVKYGVAYTYKLCANYNGLSPSRGVELVITPMVKIDSFTIRTEQSKGNTYKVFWDIKRNGIDLRILVDEKQYRELTSDSRSCELVLPADGFHTITVLAYSGGTWLRSSNSSQVNTYSPCSIDKPASQFREKPIVGLGDSAYNVELHLKVSEPIPNNVVGFYYAVRTKSLSGEGAPWVDKQETGKAPDIRKIGLSAYKSSGEIVCSETAREEGSYYVSLFTIYNFSGTEVVSNAAKCRFDRPLTADLFWKVSKGMLGGLRLTIEITANRPFERIPELVLCACSDGQHLLSQSDAKGRKLQTFPETKAKAPGQTYKGTYEISNGVALKGLKLFLFEAAAVPNENYTLRWTKGFSGKV